MTNPRIEGLELVEANGQSRELLSGIQQKLGRIPNLMKVMALSPSTLKSYLALGEARKDGLLSPRFQEQIALLVAERNECRYCLSAHTAIGKMQKLTDEEILLNRSGRSSDPRIEAGLVLAGRITEKRGLISDEELEDAYEAGLSDGEIIEIVLNAVANILTNYINHIAGTVIDFPVAPELEEVSAKAA